MSLDEVEFLEDEPPPRRSRSPQRLRAELAVGAVLMLGLFLVARLITRHADHSAGAGATTPVPSRSGGSSVTLDVRTGLPADDPVSCHGCYYATQVPEAVSAAITERFAAAQLDGAEEVRLASGRLWFREVNVTVDGRELLLRVQQPRAGDTSVSGVSGGLAYVNVRVGDYVVTAQIERSVATDLPALTRLVHDPRVLRT